MEANVSIVKSIQNMVKYQVSSKSELGKCPNQTDVKDGGVPMHCLNGAWWRQQAHLLFGIPVHKYQITDLLYGQIQ